MYTILGTPGFHLPTKPTMDAYPWLTLTLYKPRDSTSIDRLMKRHKLSKPRNQTLHRTQPLRPPSPCVHSPYPKNIFPCCSSFLRFSTAHNREQLSAAGKPNAPNHELFLIVHFEIGPYTMLRNPPQRGRKPSPRVIGTGERRAKRTRLKSTEPAQWTRWRRAARRSKAPRMGVQLRPKWSRRRTWSERRSSACHGSAAAALACPPMRPIGDGVCKGVFS